MQRHSFFRIGAMLTLAATAFFTTSLPARATDEVEMTEEVEPKKVKKKKKEKEPLGAVAEYCKKVRFDSGKPNLNAKYYFYMQSASWCGPCCKKMPSVAKAYNEMKKDGRVEIILIGSDDSPAAMKSFLKQFKAKFPGIHKGSKGANGFPGFTRAPGIPAAILVDAEGNVLGKGVHLFDDWKAHTIDKEASE